MEKGKFTWQSNPIDSHPPQENSSLNCHAIIVIIIMIMIIIMKVISLQATIITTAAITTATSSPLSEDAKLDEDRRVLEHGAERADEPGQVREDVCLVEGVEEDLCDDEWNELFYILNL